jgi:hypothetical protein
MRSADRNVAADQESIAPVTILDGLGRVIRIVPAEEFRRAHGNPEQLTTNHWRRNKDRIKTIGTERVADGAGSPG